MHCFITHSSSKVSQHLRQSADGVALALLLVRDALGIKSVMLPAKLDELASQSTGMLLPSSSSSESGARVHAGPGVSLVMFIECVLVVLEVVVELKPPWKLQPANVKSRVSQPDVVDVTVEAVVDFHDEKVVTDMPEDTSTDSAQ